MSLIISVELEERLRNWAKIKGLNEKDMLCTEIVETILTEEEQRK